MPSLLHKALARKAARRECLASPDVLVLDAALKQSLVTARSLGREGLSVCLGLAEDDREEGLTVPALWSRFVSCSEDLPSMAGDPDAFGAALLDTVRRYRPRAVVASSDTSIGALEPWRSRIEEHSRLALAPEKPLARALDKSEMLRVAGELGVAVPRTVTVEDKAAAPAALAEIGYPAVVKPQRSWLGPASRARLPVRAVFSEADALKAVSAPVDAGVPALVQEWVSGPREAVWLFRIDAKVVAEFASRTIRATPVVGGAATLRESIAVPDDCRRAAISLTEAIDLDGPAEVEFRRDAAGQPRLMEVNPRLSGSVGLPVRAGIDFPLMLWKWAVGEDVQPVQGYRTGVRLRWLTGDLRWIAEVLRNPHHPDGMNPLTALSRVIGDFFKPLSYDSLDLGDWKPAGAELLNVAWKLVSGLSPENQGKD